MKLTILATAAMGACFAGCVPNRAASPVIRDDLRVEDKHGQYAAGP
jgi:hypothetical protein